MKVIERAQTPDGIKIQFEDWTENYPNDYSIGAYPIAKRTGRYGLIRDGKSFRLTISTNEYFGYTKETLFHDFECLKSGEKTLEDLADRYWNGDKDKWLMGLLDTRPENY